MTEGPLSAPTPAHRRPLPHPPECDAVLSPPPPMIRRLIEKNESAHANRHVRACACVCTRAPFFVRFLQIAAAIKATEPTEKGTFAADDELRRL